MATLQQTAAPHPPDPYNEGWHAGYAAARHRYLDIQPIPLDELLARLTRIRHSHAIHTGIDQLINDLTTSRPQTGTVPMPDTIIDSRGRHWDLAQGRYRRRDGGILTLTISELETRHGIRTRIYLGHRKAAA